MLDLPHSAARISGTFEDIQLDSRVPCYIDIRPLPMLVMLSQGSMRTETELAVQSVPMMSNTATMIKTSYIDER